MAINKHTEFRYKVWHYTYLTICGLVFFFLIAPLFVIIPLSFNAEQYIHFSDDMLALKPEAFSLRWYEDMVYGTKNPWGLAFRNSLVIAIFAKIGATTLGTLAALGLSSKFMPYKALIMSILISPMVVPLIISGSALFFFTVFDIFCQFLGHFGSPLPLGGTSGPILDPSGQQDLPKDPNPPKK